MKRVALIFLLAIFAPSIVLAWLALRSLRDQQVVIERQQALLYQGVADAMSRGVNGYLTAQQGVFERDVDAFLAPPAREPADFDAFLRGRWPQCGVGFVISADNQILSPPPISHPRIRQFLLDNAKFLTNRESVAGFNLAGKAGTEENDLSEPIKLKSMKVARIVKPQTEELESKLESTEAEFRELCGDGTEGAFARFLQNKLNLLFWYCPQREPELIFGSQVDLTRLMEGLRGVVQNGAGKEPGICVALLDDEGKPVQTSRPGFAAHWKTPFVSTEIGEVLPHWETAVYLIDPGGLTRSVRALQWMLALLVAALVAAIAAGGWSIVSNLRHELRLARQQTDFVSNVSHELKTPLTSIRMFSELLAEGRVHDEAKRASYLHIIAAEAARLTRLINNVLDFAALDRGGRYALRECDARGVVREALNAYVPHLEESGFSVETELPDEPLLVRGDEDALAQVVVNLLSNAEKYSEATKQIRVEAGHAGGGVEIRVLDRGPGIPAGCEEKIFEKFFRAHDALDSGAPGSGLGLTLARQIARAHRGDLFYSRRAGGGSCFILRIPEAGA